MEGLSQHTEEIVYGAAEYTEHRLKTKNIIAMLIDSKYIKIDKHFQALNPVHDFDLTFLEKAISEKVKEMEFKPTDSAFSV